MQVQYRRENAHDNGLHQRVAAELHMVDGSTGDGVASKPPPLTTHSSASGRECTERATGA
jgi:hypothetical protein